MIFRVRNALCVVQKCDFGHFEPHIMRFWTPKVVCLWRLRAKGVPLWMTSPMTSAITSSFRKAIVLLFAIIRRECMECIAQGHVTGATPYCVIVSSSSNGSLLDTSKIKNAPIELKIVTGIFSTTPDTMSVSVLRENDVITLPRPFTHLLREK